MTTITLGFKNDFEATSKIAIQISQPLNEHEHIWVWDHYFCLVMHRLNESPEAKRLLLQMSEWATNFVKKMYAPIDQLQAENALVIDQKLHVDSIFIDIQELFTLQITDSPDVWPSVNVRIADDANDIRLAMSVIALAQHFLVSNSSFFRELPMHILAIRKFYIDEKSYTDEASINAAPAFAFQTALSFYQHLEEKISQH